MIYYNISQAAEILGFHPQSLRNWDRSGTFVAIKTPGGQRRYTKEMLDKFYQENLTKIDSCGTSTSLELF